MRKILVCIPKTGHSYDREFMESYTHAKNWLFHNENLIPFEFGLVEYFCHTFPIDANRNECVAMALEKDFDLTIWLDTDQEFPRDALLKLIRHDMPIVAGIYHAKNEPFFPIIFKESKKSSNFNLFDSVVDFPEKELFEADMIGMGCVAIKTEVFRQLDKPYFKYRPHVTVNDDWYRNFKVRNQIHDSSEDSWLWKQIREKTDYKIIIDPTIDVAHFGRYRVNRGTWRAYVDQKKAMIVENDGPEKLKEVEAGVCKAEPLKKAI